MPDLLHNKKSPVDNHYLCVKMKELQLSGTPWSSLNKCNIRQWNTYTEDYGSYDFI